MAFSPRMLLSPEIALLRRNYDHLRGVSRARQAASKRARASRMAG